jgi:hypothetical protein
MFVVVQPAHRLQNLPLYGPRPRLTAGDGLVRIHFVSGAIISFGLRWSLYVGVVGVKGGGCVG